MEALSPTMEEGRLVKWTKKEGDAVKAGDTLAEVETDKAVMELVARADGHLIGVLVPEGQTVPVGQVVAYIGAPGENVEGLGNGDAGKAVAPASKPRAAGPQPSAVSPQPSAASPQPSAASPQPSSVSSQPSAVSSQPPDATRVKASPLARRMAREAGVDLKLVTGSGPAGRVVKRDLEAMVGGAAVAPLPPRSGAPYEDVPLTQIRKTIARRLAASLGPIPHFFLTTEVDMERAAEARDALNRELGDRGAGKVSFNDVIVKATALALVKHRECNAWFQDDHIRYWNEVHLGMAVAVEQGLITPVIRNADLKALGQISA